MTHMDISYLPAEGYEASGRLERASAHAALRIALPTIQAVVLPGWPCVHASARAHGMTLPDMSAMSQSQVCLFVELQLPEL